MKFCNSHLTRNIFNLNMRRFFLCLVYTRLKIVDTSQAATTRSHDHCAIALGLPQDDCPILCALQRHRAATLRAAYDYRKSLAKKIQSKIARCPHDHRAVPVRGSYDVTAMCLRAIF